MIHRRLRDELDHAASRVRRLHLWQLLAVSWLLLTALGLAVLAWQNWAQQGIGSVAAVLMGLSVLATALAVGTALRGDRDRLAVARRIETAYPELSTCLLAAIEQRPDSATGRFGYLQSSVIRQAVEHAKRHAWTRVVPAARMRWAVLRALGSLALLVTVTGLLATSDFPVIAATETSESDQPPVIPDFNFTVEPGNTEVERGASLLVLARIVGEVPAEAALFWKSAGEETQLAMSRSLNDPVFGGRIPSVIEPLEYRVETNGRRSENFRVTVFEYPRLERADARLVYPRYAGLAERTIEDVRVLSVPEGTQLTLICRLNKPVASASLHEDKFEPIVLTAVTGESPVWQATFECDRTRQLRLELVDEAGRKNQKLTTFKINVLPNRPVALKPTFPARDLEASPLEELDVKATAWDDYGVKRYGVSYALAGQAPVEVVLGEDAAAKQKHELRQQIRLEELRAEPDELLSYHWWAEDLGNDGQSRRVESDMYFAEVRRFEEIFREGEQPAGGQQRQQQSGQGQNAQEAQELAKLQKDIINATWKVIRREIGSSLSDESAGDVDQIKLSQQTALEQAESLAGQVQDPESLIHVDDVLIAMKSAIQQLETSRRESNRGLLTPALAEEQKAYQALLKLRAREHRVVRQQRQSGSASSSRSQQQQRQMEELDLNDQQNPYEAQRLAQSEQQENPEERENRQVLNRLRELARRQNDLNERLKELQASLDEAQTEQQKEEIRRQLQRLQEEQQQILQDTDELQARMDQPENQERMAQEREQLEQAREQARRSSEALEQEQVTQAAATGTRAQREFEELRNEFRRRTSGQFSEEMRDMREAARELDTRQQELSREMQGESRPVNPTQPKSLAEDTQNHDRTAEGLAEQRQRLAELQEQMRRTIEDSETTEPLLAERLYEAARGVQEQNLDRALQAAESSLRRGLVGDATQQEEAAGQGVTQLREGIERAAEAVLGDEAEALRRAREELERLSRELNQEIARNQPGAAGQDRPNIRPQDGDATRDVERASQDQPAGPPQDPSQSNSNSGQRPSETQQPRGERGENGGERNPASSSERPEREPRPSQAAPMPVETSPGEAPMGESPSTPGQLEQPGQQSQPGQLGQDQQGQPQPAPSQQAGQPGQQQGGQPSPEQSPGQQQSDQGQSGRPRSSQPGPPSLNDPSGLGGAGPWRADDEQREYAPLTGGDFLRWSDRLRDVEEIVEDPELRAEAARIRERARAIRGEFKRHSKPPEWDLVQEQLSVPLMRLRNRISEELLRRTSREAIVPLDRDPVPPAYSEKTRRYYERLGTGR